MGASAEQFVRNRRKVLAEPGQQLQFQRFWEWPFWPWHEGTWAVFDVGAQRIWLEPGFLWPTGDKAAHGVLLIFRV